MLNYKLKKGGKTMAIMELVEKIEDLATDIKDDVIKFDDGNNAAGARVRKAMQNIKVIAQEVRVAVTEIKNERKGE